MAEKVTWEKIVELARQVSEDIEALSFEKIKEHGIWFDKYVTSCSKESTYRAKARWLGIKKGEKEYRVEEKFYKKIIGVISEGRAKTPLTGDSATVLCYRISEMEKCSVEEICDTLITLGLFPKGTMPKQNILDELKDDVAKKENLAPVQIKEGISSDQDNHDLREKSGDEAELPEDNVENTKQIHLNISQYTDNDNIIEVTEEDLKTFVIGFIEAMSYKIEAFYPREHSSCSELISIFLDESCVDEFSIFHQDIKPWEFVRVSYFASGTVDEEIQQEIERIHKLEKHPKAFAIIACATDEIFKYVKENVICDRQKSIMILCREHPDEAHIRLRGDKKSDEKRFEFLKPDSKKYIYI